ncbi:hypothetical protein [Roseibium marinum]|uniref:Uncharacterized protein n=1 Tax=Roseibium marinum TaxID=281252 RepID=A0A2S3V4D2_9HYPH|nr:hypothetical protein [Roseibium marinum]POF34808.1 hypothetical protein CLV41_1011268 [Roseibium marinum]
MARIVAAAILTACLFQGAALAKTVQTEAIRPPVEAPQAVPLTGGGQSLPESGSQPQDTGTAAADDPGKPQVLYNTDMLPKQVSRMHAQLKEAALAGSMERLRRVLESNELPPTLSFGEIGDPIEFLKSSSGDGEGFEILAILADILDAGFLHVDAGTPQEMYVWPYFSRYPLFNLTPDQKVELFRIVTAGDFAEMQDFGAWTFYRVGIGPDGTLHYFVAGD